MSAYQPGDWENSEKVDPEIVNLIRLYATHLKCAAILSDNPDTPITNGYLCPTGPLLKSLEMHGYPALEKQYDVDNKEAKRDAKCSIKMGAGKNVSLVARDISKDINKYVLDLLSSLPEGKSKAYYSKRFGPCKTIKETKEFIKTMSLDQIAEVRKEVQRDIFSLIVHVMIKANQESQIPSKARKNKKAWSSDELRFARRVTANIYNTISLLVNSVPMKILLDEAKNGNDESLCKALRVDKTLFSAKWVQKRINKAQYNGEIVFFDGLATAIKKTPLQNDIEYQELFLVLAFFWKIGLCRLNITTELMDVLESAGIELQTDPLSFSKHITFLKKKGVLRD